LAKIIPAKFLLHRALIAILLLLALPVAPFSHPGGLDANGGHTNRNTGEYHYHQKKAGSTANPQQVAALQST